MLCVSILSVRRPALAVVVSSFCSACAAAINLMVPAYCYPSVGSAWNALIAAAKAGTPNTAIMNPGSGACRQQ